MVLPLAGEWDVYQASQLRERLEPAYNEPEVIVDLTAAKYVTSCLISALVRAQKYRMARNMQIAALAVRSAFVRRLLSLTHVDDVFPIYYDVNEARSALEST